MVITAVMALLLVTVPASAAPAQVLAPAPTPAPGAVAPEGAAGDPAAGAAADADPAAGAADGPSDGGGGADDPAGAANVAAAAPAPSPAPGPPATNRADARAQLDQVQRAAEALTEQWHAAQDIVVARQSDVAKMQAAVQPAQAALLQAQADEETYRRQVDTVTVATYEAGNLDQLDALLAAPSPQAYLDQMSALEMISSQYRDVLGTLIDKVDRTRSAQAAANSAVARAQAAVAQATLAERDLASRQRDADLRIDQAEGLLRQLSPAQRRARDDNGVAAPDIIGTGVGVDALRAAASQVGKPYVWGATGPSSYDCSGLTSWAFRQVGITLPRSSVEQARIGTPVAWNDLQPGDLVFYYHPVSHVGIYAGDGTFLDAPQTGDVVKYQTVSPALFSTARRL